MDATLSDAGIHVPDDVQCCILNKCETVLVSEVGGSINAIAGGEEEDYIHDVTTTAHCKRERERGTCYCRPTLARDVSYGRAK